MRSPSSSMERELCSSVVRFIRSGVLQSTIILENYQKINNIIDRLPVPSLWLDVLQKIKALGFNCVSFYVDWALVEAKPGDYRAEGIFALEPFFEAAKEAGIYLLARPGPYINAEVSGGGFPGWLQRVNGTLRTADKGFLDATEKYENNFLLLYLLAH